MENGKFAPKEKNGMAAALVKITIQIKNITNEKVSNKLQIAQLNKIQ